MTDLSQDDLNRLARALAPQIVASIREAKHDFWIDPERHYKSHVVMDQLAECLNAETLQSLSELLKTYRKGRSLFFVGFVTLMVAGAIGLVVAGLGFKMPWR